MPTPPVPALTAVEVAFPANAPDWMPPMEDIPDEFKDPNANTEWHQIVHSWFANGLAADVKFYPRKDVNPEAAVNALAAGLGSYSLKHEHKVAGVAYLMSCWFKKVQGWKR